MKKFLALLMCTLMLCSLAPLSAFAAGAHSLTVTGEASIDGEATKTKADLGQGDSVVIRVPDSEDYEFDHWTANGITLSEAERVANPLTIDMPDGNVTVNPNVNYKLTVSGGTIGTGIETTGFYSAGTPVTINAEANSAEKQFREWDGPVTNPNISSTTVEMPGNALTVTAEYNHSLTVTNGQIKTGSAFNEVGTGIAIYANSPSAGTYFSGWSGLDGITAAGSGTFADPTTFNMPDSPVSATAVYSSFASFTQQPVDKTVVEGNTATLTAELSVTTTGVAAGWYSCDAEGNITSGQLAAGLSFTPAASSLLLSGSPYYFRCAASLPGGADALSDVATVTVVPALSAADVNFGTVTASTTAPNAIFFQVSNASAVEQTVTGVTLSGTDAAAFTLNKTSGAGITAGSTDSVNWSVRPTAAASNTPKTYNAKAVFTYAGGTAEADITMTVTAAPVITISGDPQSATILTGSSVNLTTTATASDGGTPTYTWYRCSNVGGTVAEQVGTNSSTYTFSSQTANTYYFKCVVSYSGAVSQTTDVATVTVSGTADVGISIPSISANVGYTAASVLKDITISNTGTTAVTINSVAVNGSNFTVTGGSNGMSLGVGNNTTAWKIQPNTGLSAGTYSATVTVTYNTTRTLSASVVFTVSAPVSVTPDSLSFPALYEGYTSPGSLNFTVTNNTGAAVVLDVVSNLGTNTRFNFAARCSAGSGRSSYAVSPKTGLRASTAPYTETLTFYNGSTVVKTVTVSVTVQSSANYAFTRGMGQYWYMGSSKLMTFECNGSYSKFLGITIDGKYVFTRDGDELYDGAGDLVGWCAEGSTIVTFSRYLQNSFGAGRYNLRFNYTDGYVDTYFRVYNRTGSPPTGDTSNMALWVGLLACSAVAAIVVVPKLIKRKGKTE